MTKTYAQPRGRPLQASPRFVIRPATVVGQDKDRPCEPFVLEDNRSIHRAHFNAFDMSYQPPRMRAIMKS